MVSSKENRNFEKGFLMILIYKLTWKLEEGVSLEKADLPDYYKVLPSQKKWSKKKLKAFLEEKHFYKLKRMEKL